VSSANVKFEIDEKNITKKKYRLRKLGSCNFFVFENLEPLMTKLVPLLKRKRG